MRLFLASGAALALATPALAQDVTFTPLVDLRLRYEHVDQAALPNTDADAVTARLRAGFQLSTGPWSVLAQGEGTLAIDGDYYDGVHGASTRPLVADPQNVALYLAQLQYKTKPLTITAGRQKIVLDDERFVGNVGFRDNAQTFDAARIEWSPVAHLKADVTYAWGVRTIWGIDGIGARARSIGGDNVFANLSYDTPIGKLTGFAYLVDQDEPLVQKFALSSQTYGGRLAGAHPFSKAIKLSYVLSYAHQEAYHRNPNHYSASYYFAEANLDVTALRLTAGYEVLGADHGTALTSFQTPLATGFKFQGWADKFLTTPANGVRDAYAGGTYGWKKVGLIDLLSLQATYHRFDSDRLSQHYGNEIDLLASAKVRKTTVSARFARYDAKAFATDTTKVWLQLDWAY